MSSFNCNECGTAIIDTDYGYVTACEHWPMERNSVFTDVSNKPILMDNLALQSPTPEQIDHDIIGELISLRQRVADLETAKGFHMACIENLVERLKDVERTVSSLELNRLRGNG